MPNLELHRTISAQVFEARGQSLIGSDFSSLRPAWAQGTISDYDSRFLAGLSRRAYSGYASISRTSTA